MGRRLLFSYWLSWNCMASCNKFSALSSAILPLSMPDQSFDYSLSFPMPSPQVKGGPLAWNHFTWSACTGTRLADIMLLSKRFLIFNHKGFNTYMGRKLFHHSMQMSPQKTVPRHQQAETMIQCITRFIELFFYFRINIINQTTDLITPDEIQPT